MTPTEQSRKVLVCDPTADEETMRYELAPRLATLDGKTIGLLDNSKNLVDTLMDEMQKLLTTDFPSAKFRHFRKASASSGVDARIYSELRDCDAVITAIGD